MDILLIPPTRVLVITGPNTGGKTVALKTAGLLPLLAQSGLLIPAADGTQVPVFRTVFADIGDEQSIAQSLSTFSGHISNIVAMDRALALPSLVLLDEAGGGTDPIEGGALGDGDDRALPPAAARWCVATTHYDALKSYAATTEGVMPAGFGFDPETFAPTYRLNYGAPGSSLALEIATRLGLPASIIERARAASQRARGAARRASRQGRARSAVARPRAPAGRARARGARPPSRRGMQAREQDLRNREETFKRRLDERVEHQVRDARREIDAVVGELQDAGRRAGRRRGARAAA